MTKLRWGIAGTGSIANQFAQDLAFVPHAELMAVGSRKADTARHFAAEHNIPYAHGSYEGLFADPNVDVIYVATPHSHHHAHATAAMAAGKHVLCEKPLTPTLQSATSLVETARASQRGLMEAMWTYFLPPIRKAMAWVHEGRIGELRHIRADFGYAQAYDPFSRMYAPQLAGGALLDMGIYPLAMTWRLLGRQPDHVHVRAASAPTGVDDDIVMMLDYGACVATLSTSFRSTLPNQCHIIGTEGFITIPDFWRARECRRYQIDREVERFVDHRQAIGLCYEAIAFGEDLRAGRLESAVVPWDTSLALQRMMERVRTQVAA